MKVNLYLADFGDYFFEPTKGEHLATVELEVVPSGTYIIDGTAYTLVGKPTFNIKDTTSPVHVELVGSSHVLDSVDLLVERKKEQ